MVDWSHCYDVCFARCRYCVQVLIATDLIWVKQFGRSSTRASNVHGICKRERCVLIVRDIGSKPFQSSKLRYWFLS